jgi:hypothetical protein
VNSSSRNSGSVPVPSRHRQRVGVCAVRYSSSKAFRQAGQSTRSCSRFSSTERGVILQAGILSEAEVFLDWPNKRSKGSMDGRGVVPLTHPKDQWRGLEYGFELKGMNTYAYNPASAKPQAKDDHLEQVHRYFLSGGFDLFVIVYEDKNTQAWKEWVIEPDPARLASQELELDRLNYAVDTETIPDMLPECTKQSGDTFRNCPFGGKGGICVKQGKEWPTTKRKP